MTMSKTPQELLEAWYIKRQEAEAAKLIVKEEQELRQAVFNAFFSNAVEGTNKYELPGGYVLKGGYKIERKVDEAQLSSVLEVLRGQGINTDMLINYKPELKVAIYRELTAEQQHIMDMALVIKPASPTLEVVEPKKKG